MLKQEIEEALNSQINAELHSSLLYLSMSAYLESLGLKGFAHWARIQMQEEESHAMKFYHYVFDRGGRVLIDPIPNVENHFDGVLDIFKRIKQHEEAVTEMINKLMDVAIAHNDHATKSFLRWVIDEQVEEVASVDEILMNLEIINGEGQGLLMMDRELAQRQFVPVEDAN